MHMILINLQFFTSTHSFNSVNPVNCAKPLHSYNPQSFEIVHTVEARANPDAKAGAEIEAEAAGAGTGAEVAAAAGAGAFALASAFCLSVSLWIA